MPGYGIKALIIIQDISQLHKIYGKDESVLSTCPIKMAFAPSKMDTAELLSRMTGITTVQKEAVTKSGTIHSPSLKHVSISSQEIQRPLMTADEILKLKSAVKDKDGRMLEPGEMLIFNAGHSPIFGTQILFFEDPEFNRQTQISPPLTSDILVMEEIENDMEIESDDSSFFDSENFENAQKPTKQLETESQED